MLHGLLAPPPPVRTGGKGTCRVSRYCLKDMEEERNRRFITSSSGYPLALLRVSPFIDSRERDNHQRVVVIQFFPSLFCGYHGFCFAAVVLVLAVGESGLGLSQSCIVGSWPCGRDRGKLACVSASAEARATCRPIEMRPIPYEAEAPFAMVQ